MRIESGPRIQSVAPRREAPASRSGGDFATAVSNEPAPSPATSAAPANAVEGLFALQEISDELTGRRRAAARGDALLERLEDLRVALLAGKLPRHQLTQLRELAREHGPAIDDPKLAAILGEIELRVAVELAKLDMLG
jgi:Class II flagellar assembly regulator